MQPVINYPKNLLIPGLCLPVDRISTSFFSSFFEDLDSLDSFGYLAIYSHLCNPYSLPAHL